MTERVERDELDTPAIVTVGIVTSVLIFVIIVALQAWFAKAERDEYARKMVAPRSEELASTQAEQEGQLHSYRWVDRQHGVVAVPIERAMELMAREDAARATAGGAGR